MAHLEPKDAAKFDLNEFTQTTSGGAVQLGVFFSGNLWEDNLAKTGEPVPPKATFVHDIPWIGKPGSSHGEGDLERLRRDPRLTTESSLAISAAQESQSIAAARLPFTASWVGISPVTWCAWSGAAPRGARSAPRKAFEAAAALPEFIELMDGREAMGPSHGSYGARRRGRSATGALLIASGFHHSLPTGGVRNCVPACGTGTGVRRSGCPVLASRIHRAS